MGDVLYKQSLSLTVAKNPQAGAPIAEKDFELSPSEQLDITDYNEVSSSRFALADLSTDVSLGMGTVALGKALIIKPLADLDIKIVNANGTSQVIKLLGGKTSVIHAEFTNVLASNSSGSTIKGKIVIVGD